MQGLKARPNFSIRVFLTVVSYFNKEMSVVLRDFNH